MADWFAGQKLIGGGPTHALAQPLASPWPTVLRMRTAATSGSKSSAVTTLATDDEATQASEEFAW
jgi:hypothetical protein